jgi:hypothetical protein
VPQCGGATLLTFIRTKKKKLLWGSRFETVDESRPTLLDFRKSYNIAWLIERHGFLRSAAVRLNQLRSTSFMAKAQGDVSETAPVLYSDTQRFRQNSLEPTTAKQDALTESLPPGSDSACDQQERDQQLSRQRHDRCLP